MDENSIVTQCPSCLTQFRVNSGQLEIANGQVRCGSCLHVFNAIQNSLTPTIEPLKKPEPEQITTPFNEVESKAAKNNFLNSREGSLEYLSSLKNSEVPTLKISAEPVTLQAPEIMPRRFAYGWLIACLLAMACIASQLIWFNRTTIYWNHPQYQSLFDEICSHINCKISSRQSLELIENRSILVTPHSEFEGAMQVQLILNNRANFQQPFPALSLEFRDLKNRLVAHRTIQPNEYLDNQQSDWLSMPIEQPIQISLEIMSPGSRAVNYKLELLAPRQ
ncbi:MAG: DUF3426 domain-containing protein [Neptuniibacter sp.]